MLAVYLVVGKGGGGKGGKEGKGRGETSDTTLCRGESDFTLEEREFAGRLYRLSV